MAGIYSAERGGSSRPVARTAELDTESAWERLPHQDIAEMTGALVIAADAVDMPALRAAVHQMEDAGLMREIPVA